MQQELWGFPAYWTFILAAVVVGTAVCWTVGGRWGMSRTGFVVVQVLLGLSGLLGSKLQSLLERQEFAGAAWELSNGFRYLGGIAGALAGLALLLRLGVVKVAVWDVLDSLALAICAAMAVVRIGCFFEGCCYGAVWHGPLAVTFPPESLAWRAQVTHGLLRPDALHALPMHPLQLYFSLWSALLFAVLLRAVRRGPASGTVFLLFVAADGFARYLLEPLRFAPVQVNAWGGLLAGVAAMAALMASRVPRRSAESS